MSQKLKFKRKKLRVSMMQATANTVYCIPNDKEEMKRTCMSASRTNHPCKVEPRGRDVHMIFVCEPVTREDSAQCAQLSRGFKRFRPA